MTEYRRTTVEVWPFAANVTGFWLLSGDRPWAPKDATSTDWSQHEMVEFLLDTHRATGMGGSSALDATAALHSTSWRPMIGVPRGEPDGQPRPLPVDVFTYVAAVNAGEGVIDRWPNARSIGIREFDTLGNPAPHGAAEPPDSRWFDVGAHGLRHFRLLTNPECDAYDAETADAIAALPGPEPGCSWWNIHLERLRGRLAGLYRPAA